MKRIITALIIVLVLAGCSSGKPVQGDIQNTRFVFEYNGVEIPVNTDAAPVIEALGEPLDYFEAESCAFQGLDKTYYYSGFELTTYPKDDDTDYISTIYFQDDSVSTPEGICIGSSAEDVIKAYGEDYTGGEGSYVYTLGDSTLTFVTENDVVVSITYQAIVDGMK
ncbi:MAG TPA: lipoprotein [Clostridiales bacterium]|nr:lipoprotein [Clostridiales bacterium]